MITSKLGIGTRVKVQFPRSRACAANMDAKDPEGAVIFAS